MHEVNENVLPASGTILRAKIPTGDITGFHRAIAEWEPFKSGNIQAETRTMGEMSEVTIHSPTILGFLAHYAIDEGVMSRWREHFSNKKNGVKE